MEILVFVNSVWLFFYTECIIFLYLVEYWQMRIFVIVDYEGSCSLQLLDSIQKTVEKLINNLQIDDLHFIELRRTIGQ